MLRDSYSNDIKDKVKQSVKIAGWVDAVRDMGNLVFVTVRDENGLSQITAKDDVVDDQLLNQIKQLKKESVVQIEGKVVVNEKAPEGVEIIPEKLVVLSASDDLPIDMSPKIKTGLDKRLDNRSVDLRREQSQAIFRIQSGLLAGMRKYLDSEDFTQVFTPCLMGVASEGGSEVFSVMYYNREAFLRQDPQLHRQLTIAGGIERLYDIGPSWRAELSHTTRHLCEHRAIAVEFSFIEDEYDVIRLQQEMVKAGIKEVQKRFGKQLKLFNVDLQVPKKFPVLEFPKVYDILEKMGKKVPFGEAYDTEGEKLLGEYVKKKYKSDFFFVNRFPFAEKPFYVMRVDDDPKWARSVDLVFKGTELSSGGQREHRYEKILEQAKEKDMKLKDVEWFTKFFKYGVPPHGGFAIGLERITMQLLNLKNVREAVLFPRDPDRLAP